MADMEMEVEVVAPAGPPEQEDEDLIDYDIDTENHGHTEDTMEMMDDSWANVQSGEVMEDFDFDIDVDGPRPDEVYLPEATDHDHEMEMAESLQVAEHPHQVSHQGSKIEEESTNQATLPAESKQDVDQINEGLEDGNDQEHKVEEVEDEAEISYEDGDDEADTTTVRAAVDGGPTETGDTEGQKPDNKAEAHQVEDRSEMTAPDPTHGNDPAVEVEHKDSQQIPGEEPEDHTENVSPRPQDHQVDTQESAAEAGEREIPAVTADDEVATEAVEQTTAVDGVETVHPEDQDPEVSEQDSTHPSEKPSEQGAVIFPDVRVHYKDEEFSLFSFGHDGFFTESSCLDEDMGTLLAKLRVELAGDIAQEDEVVLQLDELGLEFSESLSPAVLSSVTLNQILEIFDLLVKNQDPDGSRTLYTYLFTKPCPTRRFELLTESAAAGKGLEEVMHVFNPPPPQATDIAESADESGDELGDEFANEEETEHHLSQPDAGEQQHQGENEGDDDFDAYEGTVESVEERPDKALEGVEHPQTSQDAGETVEPYEEPGLAALDADDLDRETNVEAPAEGASPVQSSSLDKFEFHEIERQPNANADVQDNEHGDEAAQDNEHGDEASSHTEGLDSGEIEANGVNDAHSKAPDEELEEIDWRDEPEPAEANQASPSVTGKRTRTDDELASEDQDAKRQRS